MKRSRWMGKTKLAALDLTPSIHHWLSPGSLAGGVLAATPSAKRRSTIIMTYAIAFKAFVCIIFHMTSRKDLKIIDYHGFNFLQSKSCGIAPYFMNQLAMRIHKKKATNVVFTGEAGIGKSYLAINVARIAEGRYKDSNDNWKDRFTIDQVVFTFSDFMTQLLKLKMGKVIVFDEPSYAIGKREWYRKLNQALTKTIESFRYKIHPLFLPVINKSLLDKTIRDHLIQFQVNVTARGIATVYRLRPSQFKDKTYHENLCDLHHGMLDLNECMKTGGFEKPRSSCLGCKFIETCMVFRAQYERKKALIQDSRYAQAKEQAEKTESKMLSIPELETLAEELRGIWFIDNRIHVQKLRIALREAHNIQISMNKAYELKAALEFHN